MGLNAMHELLMPEALWLVLGGLAMVAGMVTKYLIVLRRDRRNALTIYAGLLHHYGGPEAEQVKFYFDLTCKCDAKFKERAERLNHMWKVYEDARTL